MSKEESTNESSSTPAETLTVEVGGPELVTIDDSARAMAVLCHLSMVLGLPLWLVPLLTRDNAFTLHHAKDAAIIWVMGFVIFSVGMVIWFMTCFLLPVFGLAALMWLPTLMGLFSAINSQMEEIPLITSLSRSLLGGIELK